MPYHLSHMISFPLIRHDVLGAIGGNYLFGSFTYIIFGLHGVGKQGNGEVAEVT